jgi:methyl halide transferase
MLNKKFWNDKYVKSKTGWDVGEVTTPLKEYFEQLKNKKNKILIPGCGNAYEAEYLFKNKFHSTFVLDYSKQALNNFSKRVPDFPKKQLLNNDFFDAEGKYNIIIEQTFFCAINKNKRKDYFAKMYDLLKPNGKLIGLLFDATLNEDHPPFGGNKSEYKKYFEPYFDIKVFENAYNSIKSRKGRELFMILVKK